jgi:hypothetical protein
MLAADNYTSIMLGFNELYALLMRFSAFGFNGDGIQIAVWC